MSRLKTNAMLTCLVISDGRRGIENQALGLAEAAARLRALEITRHKVTSKDVFKALPPKIQYKIKPKPENYGIADLPKIAIGCGRQAIAPLMALKKTAGEQIFTVFVQDPRIDPKHFDLVIAPQHDSITGKNVLSMIGSPNRITRDGLNDAVSLFAKKFAKLPKPRIAVLIGGSSKTHKLTRAVHKQHMQAVSALAEQNMSLMITTSRRTPKWAVADYQKIAAVTKHVWFWDGSGDNPYFAFLGAAKAILVSEDSTNMLTEACTTGKPVYTLPMAGAPGKFEKLYDVLKLNCQLAPFDGRVTNPSYTPLMETTRIANILLRRIN